MFKAFKLILNINVEWKVCSHHTIPSFRETERKAIRFDVSMTLVTAGCLLSRKV